jgi:SAM-dependent methyltransferase
MTYLRLAEHYDKCFKEHGNNNLGVDWPNYEDTLTRHQVMLELIKEENCSLLDFGCGLGHFQEYINTLPILNSIIYSGLDINESFYNACKIKYPHLDFYHIDILQENNLPNFDYIICNGTFTEKRDLNSRRNDGVFYFCYN